MFNQHIPVCTTILDGAEPLTEDDRRNRADKWALQTLNTLIAYAERNRPFAKTLCRRVVDNFGPDDELSGLLLKQLRCDREGKPKGKRKTWTDARYKVLLIEYKVLCGHTERSETLKILAKKEGLAGVNNEKKIADRITEARKKFGNEDLPIFCQSPLSHEKGD